MTNILNLYREDFESKHSWIEICDQLDVEYDCSEIEIEFTHVESR